MIDRRVQKTRQALHQALIALIVEKGYEAVTVKDILERANVGRSTFYAHYLGKEQLLQGGLDGLGKVLAEQQRAARDVAARVPAFAFSLALFEHAQGYHEVYRAMVGQHAGAVVVNRLQQVLSGLVEAELARLQLTNSADSAPALPPAAVSQFVVGALISVLRWWVDEPRDYAAVEVDAIFRRLALVALDPSAFDPASLMPAAAATSPHRPGAAGPGVPAWPRSDTAPHA